jgi:hypothetical protein
MTLMRLRTSSGNPRGRVPRAALTPAQEKGFVVFAFAFDAGFGRARADCFTGEGSG